MMKPQAPSFESPQPQDLLGTHKIHSSGACDVEFSFCGHFHISPFKAFAQTWCVAKPSLGHDTLVNVESYACNFADCFSIHSGDPCFVTSNLFSRASFAMNAYYQEEHDCKFGGSGLKSITDPSYGNCIFVGSEKMISPQAALVMDFKFKLFAFTSTSWFLTLCRRVFTFELL
ncbi:putative glucan endo-1,3-beta-D-glucosidase [Rosa chinensis]|uniref:Putative glucan endo-1,3-beta-D-glucosidase n=1 Tax=Rosa chinensis TaxID=74649 RepID=A0A2P6Q5D6_ROSCH|nr:putative glucan endo-1,3-beta-D-glucosidase [Rosa chinensis]